MRTEIKGNFDENSMSELIRKLNFVFKLNRRILPNYHFEIKIKFDDFTAICALIIYKALAYSIDNKCLLNPSTNDAVPHLFSKYQLHELLQAYVNKKDVERVYSKLKPVIREDFFIAPHPVNREVFKDKEDIEARYYKTIIEFYKDHDYKVIDCIKMCIVEISSNFYYHATDKKSILMSQGTKNKIEIVSVDTSEGIINTMRTKFKSGTDKEILLKAFKRRISSKLDKGHCGTGLWLVNELVTQLKGKLILHTSGYIYRNIGGKIKVLESSYWKGTILYVKVPITENMDSLLVELLRNEINYINGTHTS